MSVDNLPTDDKLSFSQRLPECCEGELPMDICPLDVSFHVGWIRA